MAIRFGEMDFRGIVSTFRRIVRLYAFCLIVQPFLKVKTTLPSMCARTLCDMSAISLRRRMASSSRPVASVRHAIRSFVSSRMKSLSASSALNAVRDFCWMASSVRRGVSHFSFPLNLLLHCQMTRRYLSVECHPALLHAKSSKPHYLCEHWISNNMHSWPFTS